MLNIQPSPTGTCFNAFPWPGAGTTTRQKSDDAAIAQKITGCILTGSRSSRITGGVITVDGGISGAYLC